jgi:cytochrome c oxidase subunit 2
MLLNKLFFGFSEPATPIMEGIIDFHNYIFFFLVLIFIFVFTILCNILLYFWYFFEKPSNKWDILFRNFIYINNNVTHGTLLEIIWTIIPAIVLMVIAFPSFSLLYSMDEVMMPAFTLKVIGHQWYWSYEYSDEFSLEESKLEHTSDKNISNSSSKNDNFVAYLKLALSNSKPIENLNKIVSIDFDFDSYMVPETDLNLGDHRLLEVTEQVVLPINTYIRILVSSVDVLHSFAVPNLGIKADAVPGRLNQMSLFIKRQGVFYGQCSEICGVSHGMMPITVRAVEMDDYLKWLISRNNK